MERYRGYRIEPAPFATPSGRWGVAVRIAPEYGDAGGVVDAADSTWQTYRAEDGITYILEIEAAKESTNLARNLIDRGMIQK